MFIDYQKITRKKTENGIRWGANIPETQNHQRWFLVLLTFNHFPRSGIEKNNKNLKILWRPNCCPAAYVCFPSHLNILIATDKIVWRGNRLPPLPPSLSLPLYFEFKNHFFLIFSLTSWRFKGNNFGRCECRGEVLLSTSLTWVPESGRNILADLIFTECRNATCSDGSRLRRYYPTSNLILCIKFNIRVRSDWTYFEISFFIIVRLR